MEIERVFQEDANGCTIACLAMLTGKTYRDARAAYWGESGHPTPLEIQRFLMNDGWFVRTVYSSDDFGQWPPPPFAQAHFAQVTQPSGVGHAVVVREDGVVLDPLLDGGARLSDWAVVNHVIGLWRPSSPDATPRTDGEAD